jgi:PAS domain-containing protein
VFRKQFTDLRNACAFAEAIVNTVREPLVVLDQDLRVIAASRSFYRTFKVNPKDSLCGEESPRCVKGVRLKNLAKEALWAVVAATWITGLVHQFGSWSMTAVYVAISLMMVAVRFSDRLMLKFVPRRIHRR